MPAQPHGSSLTGTWDEDPSGASIVLATGRRRHDLLVLAEPALLTDLDEAWGRPATRVPLSFLPGVSAPTAPGDLDELSSYDRDGIGVLVARGRTRPYEGKPARRVTSLARIAAGAGVRSALVLVRATSLGRPRPGDFLALEDHLNLSGAPLFAASSPVEATWDAGTTAALAQVPGVRGAGVAALLPGPVRPGRAESAVLAGLGVDVAVMDGVAEAMALAERGVRVAALAYVDRQAPGTGEASRARHSGRRAAAPSASESPERPSAPVTAQESVRRAVEAVVATLRRD